MRIKSPIMLKSTHRAILARELGVKNAANAGLRTTLENMRSNARALGAALTSAIQERDAALAELAPLKAAREKSNAVLAAANARRREKAAVAATQDSAVH